MRFEVSKKEAGSGRRFGNQMLRHFYNLVYGSAPAEFKSDLTLDESIQRLTAATRRSVFFTLTREAAVGKVSKERVSLWHFTPILGNSFKPRFIGRFDSENGQVILTGRFTMMLFVKIFMTFWFGFCFLWTFGAIVAAIASPLTPWLLPLGGVLMIAVGSGFVAFAKQLSASDIHWLTSVIQEAMRKGPPG
jgi:hypothetical protein